MAQAAAAEGWTEMAAAMVPEAIEQEGIEVELSPPD